MTEIIDGLFVGDILDACSGFDGPIVCVLDELPIGEPAGAQWVPVKSGGIGNFERAAELIERALNEQGRVLVHCGGGTERAPATVAWFLCKRRGMSIDDAYALLKRKRPIVKDRRSWIINYL